MRAVWRASVAAASTPARIASLNAYEIQGNACKHVDHPHPPGVQQSSGKSAEQQFVLSLAYSPDGESLACGCMDGTVCIFDVRTKQLKAELVGHFKPVRSLAFTPGAPNPRPLPIVGTVVSSSSATCPSTV